MKTVHGCIYPIFTNSGADPGGRGVLGGQDPKTSKRGNNVASVQVNAAHFSTSKGFEKEGGAYTKFAN